MFRSHSDHLQGAHIFLIKVTAVQHTSPNTHTICYAATSPH